MSTNGLFIHSTRHSPGRVHDVRVHRMKHPVLPFGLPSRDGSDGKKEKTRVRVYMDRGYPGFCRVIGSWIFSRMGVR